MTRVKGTLTHTDGTKLTAWLSLEFPDCIYAWLAENALSSNCFYKKEWTWEADKPTIEDLPVGTRFRITGDEHWTYTKISKEGLFYTIDGGTTRQYGQTSIMYYRDPEIGIEILND